MMIMVVDGLQLMRVSVTTTAGGVCFSVCTYFFLVCACVCERHAGSGSCFRVRKKGVIAAHSTYCLLYQADKPIRAITIDINFASLAPPSFLMCFH